MSAAANWRASADGATRQREAHGALTRCKVLAVLRQARAPLSIQAIAALAGISYHRARRALETLVGLQAVHASGPDNNRRYEIAQSGRGDMTGGPASESAVTASAGLSSSGTARPGSQYPGEIIGFDAGPLLQNGEFVTPSKGRAT